MDAGISPSEAGAVTIKLEADVLEALDLWVVDRAKGLSRGDAAAEALRDWLIAHHYLEPRENPKLSD